MSFPGLLGQKPGGAAAGGAENYGMSEQEQAIVKTVREQDVTTTNHSSYDQSDASCYGKLPRQDRTLGGHGFCARRSFWPLHVQCTSQIFTVDEAFTND